MKLKVFLGAVCAAVLLMIPSSHVFASTDTVVMNRLYNPNSGEHFYTSSYKEKYYLMLEGWSDEGSGWLAPTTGDPVYRMYNPNTGDHHYTKSADEKDTLVKAGWTYEGVGWCSDTNSTVPIYRQYNPDPSATTGTHNYSASKGENDSLVGNGWREEGIGWYAVGDATAANAQAATETAAQAQAKIDAQAEYDANHPDIIGTVASKAAIEADVRLNNVVGTGSHAKLVVATPTSAVSFGLQYDAHAVAPYTGKTMALIENIGSNAAGGQSYSRPGNRELQLGQTYKLMLTVNEDGTGSVYLNDELLGTYSNPNLAHQVVYLRVEASGRVNGDPVSADFTNIKVKYSDPYTARSYTTHDFTTNPTITHVENSWDNISFGGYVSGLNPGQDWDNAYGNVSGIIQYIQ